MNTWNKRQRNSINYRITLIASVLALGFAGEAFGLLMETVGPLKGDHLHAQPGWPGGLLGVMGHPSRVYSRDVNGSETVYFDSKVEQVVELIDLFSKMRCRDLNVRLVQSSSPVTSMEGVAYPHNVRLDVTGGIALGMMRLEGKTSSTHEPALTIFVDEDLHASLEALDWPKHLIIDNDVPDLDVKAGRTPPGREVWHTTIDFEDGKPAVDFESGLQTTVMLWEKTQPVGINLGRVTHKGTFAAPFSKEEIARFAKGEMWMTMTVGNWLTKAKPTDTRLEIVSFNVDPAFAKKAIAFKPALYYGQILFEDGSPAILDPLPWPGAELMVSFPYAGHVTPDKNGKFKVSFTKDQLKALASKRDRKNVYIPSYTTANQSTALHAFPASKLSMDEAKPGVIKIPKPLPSAKTDLPEKDKP